jgi:CheY-like chemotaxis protein
MFMRERVVLLVDDEPSVRKLVKAILHREGFQVIEAGDGIQAFNLIQEFGKDIALLLTDITMPKMDGVSLAESVRELFPRMSVLFMSAYADPDGLDRLMPRCALVRKPFLPDTLVKAIHTLLA